MTRWELVVYRVPYMCGSTDYLPWYVRHRYPVNLETIFHLFLSIMYLYTQWVYHEKIYVYRFISNDSYKTFCQTCGLLLYKCMGAFIICMTLVHNISICLTLVHNISISGHILAFRFNRKCSFLTLKVNCKLKKKKRICILRHLVSEKALFLLQIIDCAGISDCQEFH